jgi:hypothetical protein
MLCAQPAWVVWKRTLMDSAGHGCVLWAAVQDGLVIKASKQEHMQRGNKLLSAYNGGAEVPRYARKPAPAGAAGRPVQPGQAAAGGWQHVIELFQSTADRFFCCGWG